MRVLLADDQKHIRLALQMLLKHEPDVRVVGEASEIESLLTQIRTIQPDVLLLDWELPGLSSVGSLTALRRDYPDLLVIVLSVQPESRQEALNAGADDFVSKIDPPEHLLVALHKMEARYGGAE